MKTIAIVLILAALALRVGAEGFTDADVVFYGQVRQGGGGQATLLQSGMLEVTFANQADASNVVTLSAELRPTGAGDLKPYSYALRVPLKFLPDARQKGDYLSISGQEAAFEVQDVKIDGRDATLPDGSLEFYALSFASRSSQHRLDLLVEGSSLDSDGDGLPDWWEDLYGLDANDGSDAALDSDGDGWSDSEEFRRGSDPGTSNTEPQLATAEVFVPESGIAGLMLQVLDSDSSAGDIELTFSPVAGGGFEVRTGGGGTVTLADVQNGNVTIEHVDPASRQMALGVSWSDGGEVQSGQLIVRAASPSSEAGNDASLWLDGRSLGEDGEAVGVWPDRSGNGRQAMQPTADYQPRVAGGGVDFGGSELAHLFFQDGAIPGGSHTVFTAYRAPGAAGEGQTLMAGNRGHFQISPSSRAISYPGAATYQMDGVAVRGFEDSSGASVTSIFRREGELLQNIFGSTYDGGEVAAEALDPVLPTLGARRPAVATDGAAVTEAFAGRLHELLVFPTALPEQKLRDVHDYLESKWSGAVVWDSSAELRGVVLTTGGSGRHIIRGGHGEDVLNGGAMGDTLSGGPGDDVLSGGGGADRFVFGGVDTGNDVISDFDMEADVIDLSALFWGMTGDARDYLKVRLDSNFSTPVPTLDSVLLVQRPDGGEQEILLRDRVVGDGQLIQLVVEGRLRMGGLSIPTEVSLGMVPAGEGRPVRESLDQPLTIEVTRGGEGVAAALDVPVGFFQDALGKDFVLAGVKGSEGERAVVHFERGETVKTLVLLPLPDLDSEGEETWEVAVLPHYRYSVGGSAVEQVVTDLPNLWLEVLEPNAVAGGEPARVRVHRDGDFSERLVADLSFGGTAEEGKHIEAMAERLTIAAGAGSGDVSVTARADGFAGGGAKVVVLRLVSGERYPTGNPHEAVLYAAASEEGAHRAGFDHWLEAETGGVYPGFEALLREAPERVAGMIETYALGQQGRRQIGFRMVEGRPEITAPGLEQVADVRWGVQSSEALAGEWAEADGLFVEVADAAGLRLIGEPTAAGDDVRFYRLQLTLEPGQLLGSAVAGLSGASRFGISGEAQWQVSPASGDLNSGGGSGRIIAEVRGPVALEFEMEGEGMEFYVDGLRVAEVDGGAVKVEHEIGDGEAQLLMWVTDGGEAVIRNLGR